MGDISPILPIGNMAKHGFIGNAALSIPCGLVLSPGILRAVFSTARIF
jgi:hypothetical protein